MEEVWDPTREEGVWNLRFIRSFDDQKLEKT